MDTIMKISTLIDIELHGQVVMQHHLPPPQGRLVWVWIVLMGHDLEDPEDKKTSPLLL